MRCSYFEKVYKEVEGMFDLINVWRGSSIEDGLSLWCDNMGVKKFVALPLFPAWEI